MLIDHVEASVHEIAVPLPLLESKEERRRFVICRVVLDSGEEGYGVTGGFLPTAIRTALEQEFLPVLRGMDARNTEAVHERAWKVLNPRFQGGVWSMALSALDIALWDAVGRATGRTIAQMLGGARDWAPSYVTFGFGEYDIEQLVEAALIQKREGHNRLKFVVGVQPGGWVEDARRARAVRSAVGDDTELMIDANQMLTPGEALHLCRAVEDLGITWFEEPLQQNDARQLAELRARTTIPISAGQNEGHRWRLRDLLGSGAVDIIQPNVAFCGGYTEGRKVAHAAQMFNVPVANGGGWPHLNMHLIAGLMNGWRVEYHLGMQRAGEWIFKDPPRPDGDIVRIPAAPGLGMDVDTDRLRESRVA